MDSMEDENYRTKNAMIANIEVAWTGQVNKEQAALASPALFISPTNSI